MTDVANYYCTHANDPRDRESYKSYQMSVADLWVLSDMSFAMNSG